MTGTHPATSFTTGCPQAQATSTQSDRTKQVQASAQPPVRSTPPRQSFGTARRNPNQEATWAHPLARGELS